MTLKLTVFTAGSDPDPNADYAMMWTKTAGTDPLVLPDPTSQAVLGQTVLAGPPNSVQILSWLADDFNRRYFGTSSPTTLTPGTWFLAVVSMVQQ